MNAKTFRLLCVGTGLAALLAACGGGSDDAGSSASSAAPAGSSGQESPGPTTTTGSSAASPTSDDPAAGDESSSDEDSSAGGGATHELKPVRVTYSVTGTKLTSVTMSWDGKRSAMITPGGKFISTDDGTVACSSISKKCVKLPDGSSDSESSVNTNDLAKIESHGTPTDARLVAGVNTDCYRTDAKRISTMYTGKATVCIDPKSGAPLSWTAKTAAGKTITYTATKVGSPKDDDFKADWPVTDASGQ